MEYVGINQSLMMTGGVLGSIVAGALGAKLTINKSPLVIITSGLSLLPIGLVFIFTTPAFPAYLIITAVSALALGILNIAGIQVMTFIQGEVPTELLGKVMSILVILPFIANSLGSLMYGVLFERFETLPWIIVFGTVLVICLVALQAGRLFAGYTGSEK